MFEELRLRSREPRKELEAEVLRHEPVVALKAVGAGRACRPRLHRERREVQACSPSLRPLGQLGDLALVELDSRSLQQQRRFPLVQPEVRHADLLHPSLRSPAGERQCRLRSARDRDLRAGGNVLAQLRQRVQAGRVVDDGMQIVEHEHERALERRQDAPYTRDAFRPGGSSRAGQRGEHLGRERLDGVNRGGDVAEEQNDVVVSVVECQPRERTRISLGPACKEGRLAVPRGRDHRRERHALGAEPSDHVRLRHRAGPDQRRTELDLREVERNLCNGHSKRMLGEGATPTPAARPLAKGYFTPLV